MSEEGQHTEAFAMLLELERDHQESTELLCALGALAQHMGADGVAGDFFRRCLSFSPTDPHVLVTAGAGLSRTGDPEAEPALRLAALTAPDMALARLHYGAHLVRSGLVEQGMEELDAARTLDPDDVAVRHELAVGHLVAGRPAQALEELESAVAADEENPETRLLLGLTLLQAGEAARAAEELHPVAEPLADDGEVQVVLALCFALEGWESEAWLALSRAEAAERRPDPEILQDVEDALEAGEDAIRALLFDEVAPSTLRDRLYREF
jgi:Flp pilus assembly protein TadD